MSMLGVFRQASPGVLMRLQAQPSLVEAAVRFRADTSDELAGLPLPANVRAALATMPEAVRQSILAPLRQKLAAGAQARNALVDAGVTPQELPEELSIDKAWHGLHFLLSGDVGTTETPLGTMVLGGQEVGEDLGYGPARLLLPEQVAAAADAVEALPEEQLSRHYDVAAMDAAGVYPGGWSNEPEESLAWLLGAFRQVRHYYVEARGRGYGMLVYIT